MTSKKKIDDIVKGSALDRLASGVPSIVEQAAMARGVIQSEAVRNLLTSPSVAWIKAQTETPGLELIKAAKLNALSIGNLDTRGLLAMEKAARGVMDQQRLFELSSWQQELSGLSSSAIARIAPQQTEVQRALSRMMEELAAT